MAKKIMRKILCCFIITVSLMSAMQVFIPEVGAILRPYAHMGTVVSKDIQSETITIQTEYEYGGTGLAPEWVSYSCTLEGVSPNGAALSGINVGDYVEAHSLGAPGGDWVTLAKLKSSTEKGITDIYGDPAYLMSDPLGDYKIEYKNKPDCSACSGCNCQAKYTDVTIIKGGSQVDSHRLYPGQSHVYKEDTYRVDITFHSGQAYVYPECTDAPCFGPQSISNFVIHITATEDRYALIIGINNYTWGPPNLLGAPIKNAEGIYELLTKGFGYREENVELLTSIDETTKSSIREAYERLSDKSNNGRNTLFYHHSGHGDQENVLIVHGQEVIEFSDSWMYDTSLRDYFNPIKNIGIVFDTCYSGGFCTETDESTTHLDLIGIYTDEGGIDIMDNTQRIILMSSRSEYETIVSKGVPMLFTDFLIRAFTTARESANKDDDPRISLQEAYDYANDNCAIQKEYMFNWEEDEEGNLGPTEERIHNHPVISDNYDGEFYLSDKVINNNWDISAKSPIHLHAYDSQGRHTGFNPDNLFDNEIPGSYYSGPTGDETIIFFDPSLLDKIRFEVEAFEEGEFDLVLNQFINGETSSKGFRNIQITENSVGYITMSQEGIQNELSLDIDGNDVIDEVFESSGLPFAAFTYSPIFFTLDETITFDAYLSTDLDGTIESWVWDFGDGSTGTGKIVSHSYSSPGNYGVTLTVTDDTGLNASAEKTVIVYLQNQPPFNPSLKPDKPEPQPAGTTITLTASATDPDGDSLYYQFWIRGPATGNSWTIMREWSTDNTWAWYTSSADIGDTDVSVWIRDGNHKPPGSYDLERIVCDYQIASGTVGAISIASSPSGAIIGLETPVGMFVGPTVKTPHTFTNVPVGTSTITLSLDGYHDWSTNVQVRAGETTNVHAELSQAQKDTGLVAEWRFDEGSGNIVKDSSGNGNDGIVHGATFVDGVSGYALNFDGVEDYVNVKHNEILNVTDQISIEAWINWHPGASGIDLIVDKGGLVYWFIIDSGDAISMCFMDEIENTIYGTGVHFIPYQGKWVHAVGTYDGTDIRLYLDGELVNHYEHKGKITTDNRPLRIGANEHSQDNFEGKIDEVRIYNRALSADEILERYNNLRPLYPVQEK